MNLSRLAIGPFCSCSHCVSSHMTSCNCWKAKQNSFLQRKQVADSSFTQIYHIASPFKLILMEELRARISQVKFCYLIPRSGALRYEMYLRILLIPSSPQPCEEGRAGIAIPFYWRANWGSKLLRNRSKTAQLLWKSQHPNQISATSPSSPFPAWRI